MPRRYGLPRARAFDTSTQDDAIAAAIVTARQFAGVNAQTGTAYTFAASDAGKIVTRTNAGASTVTIPTNAAVPGIPIGSSILVVNLGAGAITPNGAGTTIHTASITTIAQGAAAMFTKLGTDTWLIGRA